MRTQVSGISLVLFTVLFLAAVLGPHYAIPGHRWSAYALAAVFAILPLAVGPGWHRLTAALGLILSAFLIFEDFVDGQRFQQEVSRRLNEHRATQPSQSPTNHAGEQPPRVGARRHFPS